MARPTTASPRAASTKPADRPALVVAGAGAAGAGLALALTRAGWPLDVLACRSADRARERAELVGAGRALSLDQLCAGPSAGPSTGSSIGPGVAADDRPRLVLVAVPDRAIASVAARLAARPWPAGSLALHLSGSVEVEALQPLRAAGLAVGGCHPLKSFVDPQQAADTMAGTVFAVEGDAPAAALAQQLARDLGGRPFALAPGRRAAWHAAASHAANHLVALLDQSLDLAQTAGLSRDEARAALLSLAQGTLANLTEHTPAEALTGPVVRGEVEVVARHLETLATGPADTLSAYRALARRALALSEARGTNTPEQRAALRRLLDQEPSP